MSVWWKTTKLKQRNLRASHTIYPLHLTNKFFFQGKKNLSCRFIGLSQRLEQEVCRTKDKQLRGIHNPQNERPEQRAQAPGVLHRRPNHAKNYPQQDSRLQVRLQLCPPLGGRQWVSAQRCYPAQIWGLRMFLVLFFAHLLTLVTIAAQARAVANQVLSNNPKASGMIIPGDETGVCRTCPFSNALVLPVSRALSLSLPHFSWQCAVLALVIQWNVQVFSHMIWCSVLLISRLWLFGFIQFCSCYMLYFCHAWHSSVIFQW